MVVGGLLDNVRVRFSFWLVRNGGLVAPVSVLFRMVLTCRPKIVIIESTGSSLQNINIAEGDDAYGPPPMGLHTFRNHLLKVFKGKSGE